MGTSCASAGSGGANSSIRNSPKSGSGVRFVCGFLRPLFGRARRRASALRPACRGRRRRAGDRGVVRVWTSAPMVPAPAAVAAFAPSPSPDRQSRSRSGSPCRARGPDPWQPAATEVAGRPPRRGRSRVSAACVPHRGAAGADADAVEDVLHVLAYRAHRRGREWPRNSSALLCPSAASSRTSHSRRVGRRDGANRAGIDLGHVRAQQHQRVLLVGEVQTDHSPEQQVPFASGGRRKPNRHEVFEAVRVGRLRGTAAAGPAADPGNGPTSGEPRRPRTRNPSPGIAGNGARTGGPSRPRLALLDGPRFVRKHGLLQFALPVRQVHLADGHLLGRNQFGEIVEQRPRQDGTRLVVAGVGDHRRQGMRVEWDPFASGNHLRSLRSLQSIAG